MKQKHFLISLTVLAIGISVDAQTKDNVKTTFQTSREWKPSIDNRADAVMVYGVGEILRINHANYLLRNG